VSKCTVLGRTEKIVWPAQRGCSAVLATQKDEVVPTAAVCGAAAERTTHTLKAWVIAQTKCRIPQPHQIDHTRVD
jgi:hypothetical protein